MMSKPGVAARIVLAAALPLFLTACGGGEETVSFSQDVKPVLDENCLSCHQDGGTGYVASGFSMASYELVMKGTRNGPMVIAGDVEGSNMLVLMEGRADPSISMPHGSMDPVASKDIEKIRSWIAQGAKNN